MLPTMVDEESEESKGWRFAQYKDDNSLKYKVSEAASGGKKRLWKCTGNTMV